MWTCRAAALRTAIVCLGVAVIPVAGGAAHARAQVFGFTDTEPLPVATALPECGDDTVGSQVGTETVAGQVTDTGTTFHAHGTDTLAYTVTFADGRYVTGGSVEHFSFTAAGPLATNTVAIHESRTVFSTDGQAVGTVRIHALSHLTYRDADGDGAPDPGEISAGVDRFFFTCGR
jgi:hypothetical protein